MTIKRLSTRPPARRSILHTARLLAQGDVSDQTRWQALGLAPIKVKKSARPECGARTRAGGHCRAKVLDGRRRCRLHGGLSTGPKTAEGKRRCREGQDRARARRRLEKQRESTAEEIAGLPNAHSTDSQVHSQP
jgi:hypothetical protein